MDALSILLGNGFLLAFILLVLLIVLTSKNGLRKKKIKDDIKKIKEQISKS